MPTVGLVGVGLIGRAWANVFARAGWDVKCWDANPDATANAPKLVAESLNDLADPRLRTRRRSSDAAGDDGATDDDIEVVPGGAIDADAPADRERA